mgnify:CR=1 FL=1
MYSPDFSALKEALGSFGFLVNFGFWSGFYFCALF